MFIQPHVWNLLRLITVKAMTNQYLKNIIYKAKNKQKTNFPVYFNLIYHLPNCSPIYSTAWHYDGKLYGGTFDRYKWAVAMIILFASHPREHYLRFTGLIYSEGTAAQRVSAWGPFRCQTKASMWTSFMPSCIPDTTEHVQNGRIQRKWIKFVGNLHSQPLVQRWWRRSEFNEQRTGVSSWPQSFSHS